MKEEMGELCVSETVMTGWPKSRFETAGNGCAAGPLRSTLAPFTHPLAGIRRCAVG